MEIREHPDAPDFEELQEFSMEPVPPAEIARHRERGDVLVEYSLREHPELQATIDLDQTPLGPTSGQDVGTALYRLIQLFGTPNVETYPAGTDLREREDATFKYLFEVVHGDPEAPEDEWLVTVHDWHVQLGASLAAWREDPEADPPEPPVEDAIVLLALVRNVAGEPVPCEYEEVWY